jgi:tetratricopeptide (TPR) repeat protein
MRNPILRPIRFAARIGLLAGGLWCAGCATPPEGEDRPFNAEAVARYGLGIRQEMNLEPEEAIESFRASIEADPVAEAPYRHLAASYLKLQRQEDALAVFEDLAERYPRAAPAQRWLGLLYQAANRPEDAIPHYRAALRLDPSNAAPALELAAIYANQDRIAPCVKTLRNAWRSVEDRAGIIQFAGQLAVRLKRADRSEDVARIEEFLMEAGSDATVEERLGIAAFLRVAGRLDAAEAMYTDLETERPTDARAKLGLASVWLSRQEVERTLIMLEDVLDKVDKPLEVAALLGRLYAREALQTTDPSEAENERNRAIGMLEQALQAVPDDPDLLFLLGELYARSGRFEKAIETLEIIEQDFPDNLQIQDRMIRALLAANEPDRARLRLLDVADDQPENWRVRVLLSDLFAQQNDTDRAIAYLQEAIRLTDRPEPHLKMALLLLHAREEERAAAILEQAVEKMPDHPAVREIYGRVLFRMGRPGEAARQYESALALLEEEQQSISPFLLIRYATALQNTGRTEEAARQILRAAAEEEDILSAYYHYAISAAEPDDLDHVDAVLRLLREERPDDPTAATLQGLLYARQHRNEEALTYYREAESLYEAADDKGPTAPARFYFWFGAALERTGNREDADLYFQRCIERDPNFAEAYNYIAYMWAERGAQLERAERLVRKALELDPGNGAFLDTLGWVYYHQGRIEEALDKLLEAAAVEPDDPTILDHIGDALIRLDRAGLARDYWRRALEEDPENETIRDKLNNTPEGDGGEPAKSPDPEAPSPPTDAE